MVRALRLCGRCDAASRSVGTLYVASSFNTAALEHWRGDVQKFIVMNIQPSIVCWHDIVFVSTSVVEKQNAYSIHILLKHGL